MAAITVYIVLLVCLFAVNSVCAERQTKKRSAAEKRQLDGLIQTLLSGNTTEGLALLNALVGGGNNPFVSTVFSDLLFLATSSSATTQVSQQAASKEVQELLEQSKSGDLVEGKKRSIVPGVIDEISAPLEIFLERIFGQNEEQPRYKHRDVSRAPVLQCLDANDERSAATNFECAMDQLEVRPGSYVWSMTSWGDKVFIGEKADVACEFAGLLGGSGECAERNEQDRIYMLTFNDDCEGTVQMDDITPEALVGDFGGDASTEPLTSLRGFACVDLSEFDNVKEGESSSSSSSLYSSSASANSDIDFDDVFVADDTSSSDGTSSSSVSNWAHGGSEFCVGFASNYNFGSEGVRVFVFNAKSGDLVATGFTEDIGASRGLEARDGRLFASIRQANEIWGGVLEWRPTADNPLNFVQVGNFEDQAGQSGELTFHNGRLFSATISTLLTGVADSFVNSGTPDLTNFANAQGMKVMMSPLLSTLTEESADDWVEVFDICAHDPDPLSCKVASAGAMTEHKGELYFGTLNLWLTDIGLGLVTCGLVEAADNVDPNFCNDGENWNLYDENVCDWCDEYDQIPFPFSFAVQAVASLRAARMYRGTNLGRGPESAWRVVPLYQQPTVIQPFFPFILPVYSEPAVFGGSGFGNAWNGYAWSATSFKDELLVGTYDSVTVFGELLDSVVRGLIDNFVDFPESFGIEWGTPGADLWRMDQTRLSAQAETLTGFDQRDQYGIRQLVPFTCPGDAGKEVLLAGTGDIEVEGATAGWRVVLLEE